MGVVSVENLKIWFKALIPIFAGMTVLVFSGLPVFADEIILKEGRTLQGTITGETDQEYTLYMASKMFLRIDKTKVSKVIRTTQPKKSRPTVRTDSLGQKPVGTSTAPASAAKPSAPAVLEAEQVKTGVQFQMTKKEQATVEKTIATKTYTVVGSTMSEIKSDIFDKKQGKGFLVDRERSATQTRWQLSWDGAAEKEGTQMKWKWAVVRATITTTFPAWKVPPKPDSGVVSAWNDFLNKNAAYVAGESEIIGNSIDKFAEELALIRSESEPALRQQSQVLCNTMKEQTHKKGSGYQRRMKKIF